MSLASLKPLKSVAHSLAHQFASTLNYWHDDYAICHLAKAAKAHHVPTVVIDVLAQKVVPEELQVGVIAEFVPPLKDSLDAILHKEGFSIENLESATLTYNFAVERVDLLFHQPTYDCISSLSTKEGKKYDARLTERSN